LDATVKFTVNESPCFITLHVEPRGHCGGEDAVEILRDGDDGVHEISKNSLREGETGSSTENEETMEGYETTTKLALSEGAGKIKAPPKPSGN